MRYVQLKKAAEAPKSGQMLAYTRKQVIFQPYSKPEEVEQALSDAEVLELHLFDRDREYRAVASRSPRFPDGVIETAAEFAEDRDVYKETAALEEEFGKAITVLNHIHFDQDSGMGHIDNYRLRMGGESDGR